MRDLKRLRQYQIAAGDDGGAYILPSPIDGADLRVVASWGAGWDHVSVSRQRRIPNWTEMQFIYANFFNDDELVVQYHVPQSQHVNFHPFCLHLWRPNDGRAIPQPPTHLVGPK